MGSVVRATRLCVVCSYLPPTQYTVHRTQYTVHSRVYRHHGLVCGGSTVHSITSIHWRSQQTVSYIQREYTRCVLLPSGQTNLNRLNVGMMWMRRNMLVRKKSGLCCDLSLPDTKTPSSITTSLYSGPDTTRLEESRTWTCPKFSRFERN